MSNVTLFLPLENGTLEMIPPDVSDAESEKASGEKKYGDVKFADPENGKYPIDTEEHIRAAWNYIHKGKDADKYSSEKLAEVKRRIVSAWKEHIEKSGPPEAREDAMAESETKEEKREEKTEDSAGERMTKVIMDAMEKRFDAFSKRMDAMEADKNRRDAEKKEEEDCARRDAERRDAERRDAEEREKKEREDAKRRDRARRDGESEEEYKKRCDAEEREEKEREDRARKDAARRDAEERDKKEREDSERRADAVSHAELKREVDRLRNLMLKQPTDDDRNALADIRERIAGVASYYDDAVPTPLPGESPIAFRRRAISKYQPKSKNFAKIDLATITDPEAFDAIEAVIIQDAVAAAKAPGVVPLGTIRERKRHDETGRVITEYEGDPRAWTSAFAAPRMIGSLNVAKGNA